METQATPQQFYGLTAEGEIIVLPKAEYAAGAIRQYMEEHKEQAKRLDLTFTEHEYRGITSAIDAELNDVDGDTLIPTYFIIPYHTLHAVFPHPSVDTIDEVLEWLGNWREQSSNNGERLIEQVGPIMLSYAKANWPWPAENVSPTQV